MMRDEEFVRRLFERRPDIAEQYRQREAALAANAGEGVVEDLVVGSETIVNEQRPVLFIKEDKVVDLDDPDFGTEAKELIVHLVNPKVTEMIPLVGRIDVTNFPNNYFLGTAWFVAEDVVITNRHVASLIAKWDGRQFAFVRGVGGRRVGASVATSRERDEVTARADRTFAVREVLFIESEDSDNDIAFLRVARRPNTEKPFKIEIAPADLPVNSPVCVIGYPAHAPRSVIPDQDTMNRLFANQYDVKRIAPGLIMRESSSLGSHDCSTLGGNSGSVVLDLKSGKAAGLHFAGRYKEANYAVRASVLDQYVRQRRWNTPAELATRPEPGRSSSGTPASVSIPYGSVTVTIPLTITVGLGAPVIGASDPASRQIEALDPARVEDAAIAFWKTRPPGVLAVRVGFIDDGERFTDKAFIAVSVSPDRVGEFSRSQPDSFEGVPVRFIAADVSEQLEGAMVPESSTTIAYDDDARKGQSFSFAFVDEEMDVLLHVGPEYSWRTLETFLQGATGKLVSAMYEFHGDHIAGAIEAQLAKGVDMTLVLDNATFTVKKEEAHLAFDRIATFKKWAKDFPFVRIVAPEGSTGLISDAYHIKVSVRDDDTFWLSSGNWKKGSSQPVISDGELQNATVDDLPGNREWHVVITNPTLAGRFRAHILQDFKTSGTLGGDVVPASKKEEDESVLIPLDGETLVEERKPPERVIEPLKLSGKVRVKPLLTPDHEGSVYSDAVLDLIEGAKASLLFQIPYIGMRPKPNEHRGYIDDLIDALTKKLLDLDDARVLLRVPGSRFSDPRHAAWYFKSKGVDIANRMRVIEKSHTKGMVVDGQRVLIGSHNWSKSGVTLNRDASLLFHDDRVAAYFAQAFEVDWERAGKLTPKKFVKKPAATEGPAGTAAPVYHRVPLSTLLGDD